MRWKWYNNPTCRLFTAATIALILIGVGINYNVEYNDAAVINTGYFETQCTVLAHVVSISKCELNRRYTKCYHPGWFVQYKDSQQVENRLKITSSDCFCNDSTSASTEMSKYEVSNSYDCFYDFERNNDVIWKLPPTRKYLGLFIACYFFAFVLVLFISYLLYKRRAQIAQDPWDFLKMKPLNVPKSSVLSSAPPPLSVELDEK